MAKSYYPYLTCTFFRNTFTCHWSSHCTTYMFTWIEGCNGRTSRHWGRHIILSVRTTNTSWRVRLAMTVNIFMQPVKIEKAAVSNNAPHFTQELTVATAPSLTFFQTYAPEFIEFIQKNLIYLNLRNQFIFVKFKFL